MRLTIRAEIGAFAVLALGFGTRTAMADYPPSYASGGCATGTCATATRSTCGSCTSLQASLIQKRYGWPACGPKLSTGGCYGYHPTQWSSWDAACPGWGAGLNQTGVIVHPQPAAPAQVPAPMPQPAVPMKSPTPATPPQQSRVPTAAPAVPGPVNDRGLILPSIPTIPTSTTAPR
jgi:hypothetical protein